MLKAYHIDRDYREPLVLEKLHIGGIGRIYCLPGDVIHPHLHTNLFELTVITGGKGLVYTGEVALPVQRGDTYLTMPCDIHKIVSDAQSPLKYDFLAFSPKDPVFAGECERLLTEHRDPLGRVFRDPHIPQLVSNAIAELNAPGLFQKELLSGITEQVVIYLFRHYQPEATPQPGRVSSAEVLCYQLMNYVETHLFTMKNLEELAPAAGYSYGYLSDLFRKTTGMTLSVFHREKKLQAAAGLLRERKLSVAQIAELLGYSSPYAFTKMFARDFGLSPRAYRNTSAETAPAPEQNRWK